MKLILLGSGNLATHLSVALQQSGHEVLQVFSRTKASSSTLAHKLNVPYTVDIKSVRNDADVYIYAVSDDAISELVKHDFGQQAIHIHTAGSVGMEVFEAKKLNYGVLYPLQSFSINKTVDFKEIPIFIEGNNPEVERVLMDLAQTISQQVYKLDSEKRLQMHIAAVFVSNFVNYLYSIGKQIVNSADLPFAVLHPLIEETAQKIKTLSPYDAQTGPARRMDSAVIAKHLDMLKDNPSQETLYRHITQMIMDEYLHQS